MAAGLPPRHFLLHPPPPQLADRLAGIASRPADRRAIQQRQKLFVHATAEVRFIVSSAGHQRADQKLEDKARLRKLAGLESIVVTARPGVGITGDPLAEVTA